MRKGILLPLLVTLLFCLSFAGWPLGGWGSSSSGTTSGRSFYDLSSPYEGAIPITEYKLCNVPPSGRRLFCVRSQPSNGYSAGVLSAIYINFTPPGTSWDAVTSFPVAYRWLTDSEFLILNWMDGVPDTVTRRVIGDTTDAGDWIPRSGVDGVFGYPTGTMSQWNNPWSSLTSVYAGTGSETGVRATIVRPYIEFVDSVEVWMRSFGGSYFNSFGTYNDVTGAIDTSFCKKGTITAAYMGVEYSLVPSTSSLYGRRCRIQYTLNRPRNYDLVVCGFTHLGTADGFVRYWGTGIGTSYTIASNSPWITGGSPWQPMYNNFPDFNNDGALEFNFSQWKGTGIKGSPIFATLKGSPSAGATTIDVYKPDPSKSWSDYVPIRGDRFVTTNRDLELYKLVIRNSSAASTGGDYLAFATLTDNSSYWTFSSIYTSETTEFNTSLQGNYSDGDQVIILSNYVTEGTGSEDWPSPSGFYQAYNQLPNYDWTGYPAIMNFNHSADSVLWTPASDTRNGTTRTQQQSQYRLWGPDLSYPQEMRFGAGERVMFAYNKNKPTHGAVTESNYSWPIENTFVYYTNDLLDGNTPAPTKRFEVFNIFSGDTAMWFSLRDKGSATWANAILDTTATTSGVTTDAGFGMDSCKFAAYNVSGANQKAWAYGYLGFNTLSWEDSLAPDSTKTLDSLILDIYLTSFSGRLMSTDFSDDSSRIAVVKADFQPVTLNSELENITSLIDNYGPVCFDKTTVYGTFKGSMYTSYYGSERNHIRVSLSTTALREGHATQLGLVLYDHVVLGIEPTTNGNVGSSPYIIAHTSDDSYETSLTAYWHATASAPPADTIFISFGWNDANANNLITADEKWLKDNYIRLDQNTTNFGTSEDVQTGVVSAGRVHYPMFSFTQAGRDSIEGLSIHLALCSLYVNNYDSTTGDTFLVRTIGHASQTVTWGETDCSYRYRVNSTTTAWPDTSWYSGVGTTLGAVLDTITTRWAPYGGVYFPIINKGNTAAGAPSSGEWVVLTVTQAVADMASTVIADELRDGFIILKRSAVSAASGNVRVDFVDRDDKDNTGEWTHRLQRNARVYIVATQP